MNSRQSFAAAVSASALVLLASCLSAEERFHSRESSKYGFHIVKPAGESEPSAIRIHRKTGQIWVSPKLSDAWRQVHDVQQLPEGDYDVQVVVGQTTWYALRSEKLSGRCWWLAEGETPIEIKNRDE